MSRKYSTSFYPVTDVKPQHKIILIYQMDQKILNFHVEIKVFYGEGGLESVPKYILWMPLTALLQVDTVDFQLITVHFR